VGAPEENSSDFLLELSLPAKDFDDTAARALLWLDLIITAMRLAETNRVEIGRVYVWQPKVDNSRRSEYWGHKADHATQIPEGYELSRRDLHTLRRIYRGIWDLFRSRSFDPFRRFSTGRSRIHAQDRLIDYWIALENLFSGKDEKQELTFKYAIRIAHYIGAKPADRLKVFEDMQAAYKTRSKVIHGTRAKNLEEAETTTEAALRASLRRAALERKLPDLDGLDRLAASGK
jgi:hypothetical protein